jgi:hypothetical protein
MQALKAAFYHYEIFPLASLISDNCDMLVTGEEGIGLLVYCIIPTFFTWHPA